MAGRFCKEETVSAPSHLVTQSALAPDEIVARVRAQMAYDISRPWNNEDYARFTDALLRWAVTADEFATLEGARTLGQWVEHFVGADYAHRFVEWRESVSLDLPALLLNRENGEPMRLRSVHLAYLIVPWQGEYGLVMLAHEQQEAGVGLVLAPLNSSLLIGWAGQCDVPMLAHDLARRIFMILHTATLGNSQLYDIGMRLLQLRSALRQFFAGKKLFW